MSAKTAITIEEMKQRIRKRHTMPGAWISAALAESARRKGRAALDPMEFGVLVKKDKVTVLRWLADDGEVDWVVWCGILGLLGLPISWRPPGDAAAADPPDQGEGGKL